MVFGNCGIAVDHGLEEFEHMRLEERLDDHLVPDTIRIAGGYCYNRFHS